jgi:hypothetical protein
LEILFNRQFIDLCHSVSFVSTSFKDMEEDVEEAVFIDNKIFLAMTAGTGASPMPV